MTKNVVQRGSNGHVLGGCSIAVRCVQRGSNGNVIGVSHSEICPEGFNGNVLGGCPTSCYVQRGSNINVLGGYDVEALCLWGIP